MPLICQALFSKAPAIRTCLRTWHSKSAPSAEKALLFALYALYEPEEGPAALRGAFVDACVLQHLHEDCADLLPQDFLCVFRRERVPRLQLLRPARVLLQRLVGAQVAVLQDRVCQKRKLSVQPGRQNGEAHDLDQADVLLLDVVQRLVRMVQAQRMLRRGEVIAQDEVKLKRIFPVGGRWA